MKSPLKSFENFQTVSFAIPILTLNGNYFKNMLNDVQTKDDGKINTN